MPDRWLPAPSRTPPRGPYTRRRSRWPGWPTPESGATQRPLPADRREYRRRKPRPLSAAPSTAVLAGPRREHPADHRRRRYRPRPRLPQPPRHPGPATTSTGPRQCPAEATATGTALPPRGRPSPRTRPDAPLRTAAWGHWSRSTHATPKRSPRPAVTVSY